MTNGSTGPFFIRPFAVGLHRVSFIDHYLKRSVVSTIFHLKVVFMMITELVLVGRVVSGITTIDHFFFILDLQTDNIFFTVITLFFIWMALILMDKDTSQSPIGSDL